jgi:4'-phosphopantetheinyl transferase
MIFTPFSLQDCTLHKHQIDLWQIPLDQEFANAERILTPEELARGRRFHFARHQRRFMTARSMVRVILGRYLNILPAEIQFIYNPQGKPKVQTPDFLEFNLSHSRDTALLAIGQHYELGIDIEFFSARSYAGIARYIFSDQEIKSLNQASLALQPLYFFHLWAQKEALIKACGLGLSYPTKQFDLLGLPPAKHEIFDPKFNKPWRIISFMPHIASCAALCYHPEVHEIRFVALRNLDPFI